MFSANPDGILFNSEGMIASIEFKCHSENNYPGTKYDNQVRGHMAVLGLKLGILVKLLKKKGKRIKLKFFKENEDDEKWLWSAKVGYVMGRISVELRIKDSKRLSKLEAETILKCCGYRAPKLAISNQKLRQRCIQILG